MDRNAYQMLIAFNRETKKLDDVYRSAAKRIRYNNLRKLETA